IFYPSSLADVTGPIVYGDAYPNQQRGDTSTDGVIDEAGAFDGLQPLGDGEVLLLSIPMVAESEGTAVFASNPADQLPAHDVLLFNQSTPVPADQIDYGLVELDIVSGEAPVSVDVEYEADED